MSKIKSETSKLASGAVSSHPPSVKHAMRVAEKHGTSEARKTGIPLHDENLAGVNVAKKDYSLEKTSKSKPGTV